MSIDERGHAAGTRLLSRYEGDTDAGARFPDLAVRARRRRATRAALAAVAAVALLGGAGAVLAATSGGQPPTPSDGPTISQTAQAGVCQQPFMHCGGDGRVRMDFPVPVSWKPLGDVNHHVTYLADASSRLYLAETYRTDLDRASGVTIVEGVRAVTVDRLAEIDPHVADRARVLAQWVADRDFLEASAVRPTTVGGLDAWTVQVREKHRERFVAGCGQLRCMPLLAPPAQPGIVIGSYQGMVARFTFVDLPGSGTTVIWSWDFLGGKSLDRNQAIVDTIGFADR